MGKDRASGKLFIVFEYLKGRTLAEHAAEGPMDWRRALSDNNSAYVELPGGSVVHRRRVAFVKGSYWVIVDDLEGDDEHHIDLQFQFAPLEVHVDPTLWARARGRSGTELLVRPFASVALKASVHTGELDPLRGWVSPIYGRREPAPLWSIPR